MATFRVSDAAGSDYSDLNTGTLQMLAKSWDTVYGEGLLTENMILRAVGTDTAIIAAVKALEQRLEKALLYNIDPFTNTPYFVRLHSTNESAKHSLITGYSMLPIQDGKVDQQLEGGGAKYGLSIDHAPFWEVTSGETDTSGTGQTAFGYVWRPTISTIGTYPSRIAFFQIIPDVGITTAMKRIYVGFRPTYDGFSNFVSRLDVDDGSGFNGFNLTTGAGSSYFNGSYRSLGSAPASPPGNQYYSHRLNQHDATYYGEYRGRYLVIGRFYAPGGGTVGVQMYHGNMRENVVYREIWHRHEMVYVSGGWDYYELGEVEFPSVYSKSPASYMGDDGIALWFSTISGTITNIYLDSLWLIPSQHMVRIEDAGLDEVSGDQRSVRIATLENDEQYALQYYNSQWRYALQSTFTDWYIPVAGGGFVVFATPSSGTDIDHTISVSVQTYGRYGLHRG